MSNITDDMMKQTIGIIATGEKIGGKILKSSSKTTVKICIALAKGTTFTAKNLFKALKKSAYLSTKDIKYSSKNISIDELQKSGNIKVMDESTSAEVMHYFDKGCRKYHVKYSAMKDTTDKNNPQYLIFFEGKNDQIILNVMKEATKEYVESRKEKKNPEKNKESVLAKLKFFRNRVATREREREKNINRSDKQR